jgi:hypothetical protein
VVARQRAERPGLEHIPLELLEQRPTPIRCKQRAAEWHQHYVKAQRTAAELRERHADQADKINAALAEEIKRGPDFARCHRGSKFMDPPKTNLDRNFIRNAGSARP